MRSMLFLSLLLSLLLALPFSEAQAQRSFVTFESGPTTPLALSPDGQRLFALNVPAGRLETFSVQSSGGIQRGFSVAVGMEPVAVVPRTNDEVWVANFLSDSVSIVDVSGVVPRVKRTLLVGDEPRAIAFANGLAFVTCAHRGQHRTHPSIDAARNAGSDDGDPEFTSEGVGRTDVWVFDTADLDDGAANEELGGVPVEIVELFGDSPRALAVDGNTVYVAVFHSGNQTTTVSEGVVCDGFAGAGSCQVEDGITSPGGLANGMVPGGNPGPSDNDGGVGAPEVGLIVKWNQAAGQWQDELGRNWNNGVRFDLPDYDVFAIDATTCGDGDGCDLLRSYAGVGTILFNMVVNPSNGNVYVSNTDAQNLTRFEGAGTHGGSTVQGNLAQTRITTLTPGGAVKPRHLNSHIDYSVLPAPAGTKDHSLSTPLDMVVSSTGDLYIAAFGSGRIGKIATADLDNDALWDGLGGDDFDPTAASASYITVSDGGPAGLALNESANRLYVYTRWNNSVTVVDTATGTELGSIALLNPEPSEVVDGRFMLYDAVRTSSNGEASCASCHIFGQFDSLAWDLGDPDGAVTSNPIPINLSFAAGGAVNGGAATNEFHPMKGPMTTQTLRGMANSGGMHWKGDRTNGFFGVDASYGGGGDMSGDENLSFNNFIVAFPGLVGLDITLVPPPGFKTQDQIDLEADMQKFTDFILEVALPPNPVRALDNSLTQAQSDARQFYVGNGTNACSDGICFGNLGFSCDGCHSLDPSQGFFGTGSLASFENETQILKIPHLRNMYQKVGMFGMPDVAFNNGGDNGHKGDQIRGFGFLHDGSTDTVFRFFQATVFNDTGTAGFDGGDPQRRDMEEFMLAFDSDLAPIVGQQVTLTSNSGADIGTRIDLLIQRAEAAFVSKFLGGNVFECDLVVRGVIGGASRGWLYDRAQDLFEPDDSAAPMLTDAGLRALVAAVDDYLTYTCAPPGSGVRMALDRDEDAVLDRDELTAGTDPDNHASFGGACSDGLDNDGDGLTDLADPGCKDATWDVENPQCNDGSDNDGEGDTDLADPHCSAAWDDSEAPKSCGLGFELALLLPLAGALRRRVRRA